MRLLLILSVFGTTQSFAPLSLLAHSTGNSHCNTLFMKLDNNVPVKSSSTSSWTPTQPFLKKQQRKAVSFVASSIFTLSVLLHSDATLAASKPPTAEPVANVGPDSTSTVVSRKKSTASASAPASAPAPASPPIPAEKKAVQTAKAALDSAISKLTLATNDYKSLKAASDKAESALVAAEKAAKQTKQNFLNANDKLSQLLSNTVINPKAESALRQKLEEARAAEKQAQLDLTSARNAQQQFATQFRQADSALKSTTKLKESADKNFKTAQTKLDQYLKKTAAAAKKAAEEAAKKAKADAKRAREEAKRRQEQEAKRKKIEQEKAKEAAKKAKIAAEQKAKKIREAEQRIKELQSAKNQAEQTAKKAAADQAKIDAELRKVAKLKSSV